MAANPNLLKNTDFTRGFNSWTNTQITDDKRAVIDNNEVPGFYKVAQISIDGTNKGLDQSGLRLPAGTYTLSGWLKSTVSGKDYIQINLNTNGVYSYPKTGNATTSWSRVQSTFTITEDSIVGIRLGRGAGDTTATTLLAVGLKLEEGSVVTDWVPGAEPNMFRNSTFLSGTTFWNFYSASTATYIKREVVDEVNSPSSKAMYIDTDASGGIWQSYQTAGPVIGKTYTISLMVKGAGQIIYGWEGGKAPIVNLTDQYQYVSYTFTYASDRNFSFYTNGGGKLYFHSVKLEEGSYATPFIAAQADINQGKDRPIIATNQYTIVDYNDKVSLVSSISSNLSSTQQYSPSEEKFIPDWTKTNLVLVSSLYKGEDETNIINSGDVTSIKWYKLSVLDGTNPVLLSNDANYSILGNKLTVTQNVLNDKDSIDFICEITYKDPLTAQTLLAKSTITFSRVRNGGALTRAVASLPNGNSLQNSKAVAYKKNNTSVGRNIQRYTDFISSTSGWSWAGPSGAKAGTRTVVNEPTAPTGKAMEVTYLETLTGTAGTHKPLPAKLTPGVTYSWSVWLKASRDIADINVGSEQGGQRHVALTTSWQKFTHTFTANNNTYYSFVFYLVPTEGDKIWIHSLKLEEGPVPTAWSMAPEDLPALDQSLGNTKWVLKKYESTKSGTYAPLYNDITDKLVQVGQTITDGTTLVSERNTVATPYVGHLQTAIYSDAKRNMPFSYVNNGPASLYVNNNLRYKDEDKMYYLENTSTTDINGRNLALNTATTVLNTGSNGTTYDSVPFTLTSDFLTLVRNQYVTVSAWVEGKFVEATGNHYGVDICLNFTDGTTQWINLTRNNGLPASGVPAKRYSQTTKVLDKEIASVSNVNLFIRSYTTLDYFVLRDLKIEIGQNATDWSPAPEDGRNLLQGTNTSLSATNASTSKNMLFTNPLTASDILNNTYTLSVDIDVTNGTKGHMGRIGAEYNVRYTDGTYSYFGVWENGFTDEAPKTVKKRISVVVNPPTGGKEIASINSLGIYIQCGGTAKVSNPKLEPGVRTTTTWTPSHEEIPKTFSLPLEQGWNTIDMLYLANNRLTNGIWNVQVGGTNLFQDSTTFINYRIGSDNSNQPGVSQVLTDPEIGNYQTVTFRNAGNIYWYPKFNVALLSGRTYTISLDVKTNDSYGFYWYPSGKTGRLVYGKNTPEAIPNTNGEWQRWSFTYRASADGIFGGADATGLFGFSYGVVGAQIAFKNLKLEQTGVATPWTPAPEDVAGSTPNIFSKATQGLNAFYSEQFNTYTSNLVAKCQLQRGSIVDTTNVSYQWYKQDPTVTTDQGGGIGWLKLTASSNETGYNSDTLIIPPAAISAIEYYKCIIRDTQVDSVTYNGYFSSIVAVSNVAMPIEVRVETNGTIILNGQGSKSLTAKLFQMGREIDPRGDEYTYKWYRYLSNGTKDASWAGGIGFKTGKTLVITGDDVATKATFAVEIE